MKPLITCYVLRNDNVSQRYVGAVGKLQAEQGSRAIWRTVIATRKSPLLVTKGITTIPTITVEQYGKVRAVITGARPYQQLAQVLATLPPSCR